MKCSRTRATIAILLATLVTCTLIFALPVRSPVIASTTVVTADGWAWQNPFPTGNALRAIWGTSATNIYAVGDLGTILHSRDGSTWTSQDSGTTEDLYGIWGSSATNVYVVGYHGTILHSSDGSTWTPQDSGVIWDLFAIWGIDNTIFAAGRYGTILRTTDGTSWGPMNTATTVGAIWGTSASNVYGVSDSGRIMHYNGVGSAWSDLGYDYGTPLLGVWGSSATNIYAVGGYSGFEESYYVVLHSDGTSVIWTTQTSGSTGELAGVWGSSASNVYAVGVSGTILNSADGASWAAQTSGSTKDLYAVWGSSATNVYAVGESGTILHSIDGASWTTEYGGTTTTRSLNAVSAATTGTYAVGAYGTILHSTGDGTWTPQNSGTTQDLHGIMEIYRSSYDTEMYAVGNSGTILHSSNGGTWTPQTNGTTQSLYGISGWSTVLGTTKSIFAVGASGTILHSSDGSTWTPQTSGTNQRLNGVVRLYSSAYAVGDGGTILYYNGSTWTSQDSGTTQSLYSVSIYNTSIYAVGAGCTILYSTGDGTWTSQNSGFWALQDIICGWNYAYAVGDYGTILYSDGGGTWTPQDSGTDQDLHSISRGYNLPNSPTPNMYVVGEQGTILHGLEIPSIAEEYASVSPNLGIQGQSLEVTITGYHLDTTTKVDFGAGITVENFTVVDDGTKVVADITIARDAPPSPPMRDVSVTTCAGTATKTQAFEVVPLPLITLVTPAQGARGQTVGVTISGSYFTGATVVGFGSGVSLNSFSVVSDNQMTASITIAADASPGARDVSVTTATGTGIGVGAFTVVALPVVTSVSPGQGAQGKTISITIGGSYFTGATAVAFGAGVTVDSFTAASDTQMTASITIAADAALGARDVSVTTPAGTGIRTGGFTVVGPSTITAVGPSQGAQGQTITVTITGSRLTGATAVSFGSGITVNSLSVASDTQITASITIAADGALGARDVSVTTPGGTFIKAPAFTVLPLPAITSIGPTQAAQGQTITVTISGSYFTGATAVSFGPGITVGSFSVISDNQTTASITIAADAVVGARDVSVTTPNGSTSKAAAFKVLQMPVIATSGGSLVETGDRSPSFEGTITDPEGLVAAVQYCVDDSPSWQDGGFTRDAADPSKGSYSFITSLTSGDHTVQIRAVDAAGNVVGSVTDISVSVKKGGSKVWVIVVIAVVVVAIAGAGGYLIWRYRGKIKSRANQKVEESKAKLNE